MTGSLRRKLPLRVGVVLEVQGAQDERGHRGYARIVRLRIRMVEVIARFVGCPYEARRLGEGGELGNFELKDIYIICKEWMDFLHAVGR